MFLHLVVEMFSLFKIKNYLFKNEVKISVTESWTMNFFFNLYSLSF